jgi:hypothetical protein
VPGGAERAFDEFAALAAELGGHPDPDDPRVRAINERYGSVFVGPPLEVAAAGEILARAGSGTPDIDREAGRVSVAVHNRVGALTDVVAGLAGAGIEAADIGVRRPTLDDVFLALTGRRAERAADGDDASEREAA